MQGAVERRIQPVHAAAHGRRDGVQPLMSMGPDQRHEVAAQVRQRRADHAVPTAQKGPGVGTGLDDDEIGLAQQKQGAVGLDGAREVDLLALAIGQIGPAKGRIRGGMATQSQHRPSRASAARSRLGRPPAVSHNTSTPMPTPAATAGSCWRL